VAVAKIIYCFWLENKYADQKESSFLPTSASDKVTDRATAVTTFSDGIMAAKSNCSAIVSTVAVIIFKKKVVEEYVVLICF
jgi:hypothetical protein